ncbi:MAG: hypothetical protein LBI13_02970 [Streptococcaceae bacterium]|jgi:hypothetical protein|nr:hypothetical protein [Streptococcaceae bacterium]
MDILDYYDDVKTDAQLLELIFRSKTYDGIILTPSIKLHMANEVKFYMSHLHECLMILETQGQEFLSAYVNEKVDHIFE